jgi:DNA-binding NtrC family response regulator
VGETQVRKSRARIIAATNRNLRDEVRAGRFRGDLYHRLNVFALQVPPLREMDDDRLRLLDHFRAFYAREIGRPPFALDANAHQAWMNYIFPGNVRELRNVVIRLAAKYAGATVSREQLLAEFDPEAGDTLPTDESLLQNPQAMQELALRHLQSQNNINLDQILRQWEQAYSEAALKLTHGNLSQAARLLGVNRTTLYARMQFFESSGK